MAKGLTRQDQYELEYIRSMLIELQKMAAAKRTPILENLMAMASIECDDILTGARPIRKNSTTNA